MLFLQGTNDAFAELDLLKPVVARLGKQATLDLFRTPTIPSTLPPRPGSATPTFAAS